ncbi:MAG: hypothetical protein IJA32_11395 [Lachnospiraceae bacterium]|nr:hypothetical protein [Lachnospiraceae bacterium]
MSDKIISIEDVMDVTVDGVIFKEASGDIGKVLFDECRKNWVEYVNQGGFTDWEGNPAIITFEESRCIGERNMTAKPPYILLYSNEKIKIEMKSKKFKKLTKIQKEFLTVLYNVGGVNTFDMT